MSQQRPTDREVEVYAQTYALQGHNQSKAWRATFPKSIQGPALVWTSASAFHKLPKVACRVAEVVAEYARKEREYFDERANSKIMGKEEALERLTTAARIQITDVCEFGDEETEIGEDEFGLPITTTTTVWRVKNHADMDPLVASCVKSVTMTRTGPKVELYDGLAATRLMADMQGWNAASKQELTSPDGSMTPTTIVRTIVDPSAEQAGEE